VNPIKAKIQNMKKVIVLLLMLISFSTFAQSTKSILFIGNSYTAVNNLPQLVHDIAINTNDTLLFDSSSPGSQTFQLHCSNATTIQKINQQSWDYVVLQEQSQIPSFPPSQVETDCYPYAKKLDSMISAKDSCTQVIFYMTWGRKYGDPQNCVSYPPLCTYAGMQQRLRESYLEMADSNWAWTAPVGAAFRNSRIADSTINLYQSDLSHPSLAGSYLAACVMYARIFKKSPIANPFMSTLGTAEAFFLQNIAKITVLDSITLWNDGKYSLPASCTTGTATNSLSINDKQELKIYPNPATTELTIEGKELNGTVATLINVMGQKVMEQKIYSDKTVLTTNFTAGLYYLILHNNSGLISSKIVAIN
jgi:hypothetical protein